MSTYTLLDLTRGCTGLWDVAITDAAGAAVNLTGASFRLALWSAQPAPSVTTDSGAALVLISPSGGIAITTAATGLISITVNQAQSAALMLDQYFFNVLLTTAAGETYPCATGAINVFSSPTHAS